MRKKIQNFKNFTDPSGELVPGNDGGLHVGGHVRAVTWGRGVSYSMGRELTRKEDFQINSTPTVQGARTPEPLGPGEGLGVASADAHRLHLT